MKESEASLSTGVSSVVFSAAGFSPVLRHDAGADSPKYHIVCPRFFCPQ